MKQFTFTVVEHAAGIVAVAMISDNDAGGAAVPAFGMDALRTALLYLENVTGRVMDKTAPPVVAMLDHGKTLEQIRAELAAAQRIEVTPGLGSRVANGNGIAQEQPHES